MHLPKEQVLALRRRLPCEFRRAGDLLSLDYATENEDGDMCLPLDALADSTPSIEEVICDKAELEMLFDHLRELMPKAMEIGKFRQKSLIDEPITKIIGLKHTTFQSRLTKAKKQLASEFSDRFYSYLYVSVPTAVMVAGAFSICISSIFTILLLIFQKNFILLRQTAYLTSGGKCKKQ